MLHKIRYYLSLSVNTGYLSWINKLIKIRNILIVSDIVFIFLMSYFFADEPCIMSIAGVLFLILFTIVFLINFVESQQSALEKRIRHLITSFGIIIIPIFIVIQLIKLFENCL